MIRTFLIIQILWLMSMAARAEEIPFATYHDAEPFITNTSRQAGLTYELAELLSRQSGGQYQFKVKSMTRPRLDRFLKTGSKLAVPWVNPIWFKDEHRKRYHWTRGYMDDSNSVISPITHPVEYSGPASLRGMKVAGLAGTFWLGLELEIERGTITRVEGIRYWDNMRMVYLREVDAALMPARVARYLISSHDLAGKIYFSVEPQSRYERHFLVKGNAALHDFLEAQVPFLRESREWRAILARYGQ